MPVLLPSFERYDGQAKCCLQNQDMLDSQHTVGVSKLILDFCAEDHRTGVLFLHINPSEFLFKWLLKIFIYGDLWPHPSRRIFARKARVLARGRNQNLKSEASLKRGKICGNLILMCETAIQVSSSQLDFHDGAKGKLSFLKDFADRIEEESYFLLSQRPHFHPGAGRSCLNETINYQNPRLFFGYLQVKLRTLGLCVVLRIQNVWQRETLSKFFNGFLDIERMHLSLDVPDTRVNFYACSNISLEFDFICCYLLYQRV